MKRPLLAVLAVLLVVGVGAPTWAQTDDRQQDEPAQTDVPASRELDRLKGVTVAEVERRLTALDRLSGAVATAPHLTEPHRLALENQIGATRGRLDVLRSLVAESDSLLSLGALIPRIVSDYWVFALVVPKAHEVIAADSIVAATAEFDRVHARIGAVVSQAAAAGLDVADARASLEGAIASSAQARRLAVEVPSVVLPVTPDDMPEQADVLVGAARTLGQSFESLRVSIEATRQAVAELRAALPQSET